MFPNDLKKKTKTEGSFLSLLFFSSFAELKARAANLVINVVNPVARGIPNCTFNLEKKFFFSSIKATQGQENFGLKEAYKK